MFCTGQKDVDPIWRTKKATAVLAVTSHQGNHHDLCLLTLKIINGCDSQSLEESGLGGGCSFRLGLISREARFVQVFLVSFSQGDGK